MTVERRAAHLLTMGALFMSAGCQAIATIFETGVWVGVILVLVILGAIAFVVGKLRGGGGPPRGTITVVAVVLVGTALSAGAPPVVHEWSLQGGDQERTGSQQQQPVPALDDMLLQGCLARDDGSRSGQPDAAAERGASSAAEGRDEMFVLRGATRIAADAGGRAAAGGSSQPGETYRLAPIAELSLNTFEGQRVEVRGRLREGDHLDAKPSTTDHRNSQAVQGGQMQAVGQTMSGGQGGQSGQSTETSLAPSKASADGTTGDALPTMVVTSVRVLAPKCGEP